MSERRAAASLDDLLLIMDALRDPESGCPWDLVQTFSTIVPHTLEETYEVIDAIEQGDMAQLVGELGDLLFQIVFYARLGKEQGDFDFDDIVAAIAAKLLRRHPHVFPDGSLASAGSKPDLAVDEVAKHWEQIKQAERDDKSVGVGSLLDDTPQALGALLRAGKLQKRVASVAFDWQAPQAVLEKVREELAELESAMAEAERADAGQAAAASEHVHEEYGDLLFTMVNLSRHLKIDAETALRAANRKFEKRFRALESLATQQKRGLADLDEEELERLWSQVKAGETAR